MNSNGTTNGKQPKCILLLLACAPFLTPAPSTALDRAGGEVGATRTEESHEAMLGPLRYLRGRSARDDISLINGGAIGSATLIVSRPLDGESDWFFVEGDYMFMQIPGYPLDVVTTQQGMSVTCRQFYKWNQAVPADRAMLNYALAKFYQKKSIPRHTPFIADPNVWPQGLSVGQAKAALGRVDLRHQIKCDPGTTATDTCIVTGQDPPGGTELGMYATVVLTVDCSSCPPPSGFTGIGDVPAHAATVQDNGDDGIELITAQVTAEYSNFAESPTCPSAGKDFFWQLPPRDDGTKYRVTAQDGSLYELAIVAWQVGVAGELQNLPCGGHPDCCDSGLRPEITFPATFGAGPILMAEIIGADEGEINLIVEWIAPDGAAAAQEQGQVKKQ